MEILSLALDNLVSPPVLGFALGLVAVETLSGLDSGVPDGTLGGESSTKLWDHERAAVAIAAANVPKVPTP